jgi:hypothetical protein
MGRDSIHNRSAKCAIQLYLRLAGEEAPCLSAVHRGTDGSRP